MAVAFFAFNCACLLDQLPKQQQLFSNGGFTGIGVRNNRERTALVDFFLQDTHSLNIQW